MKQEQGNVFSKGKRMAAATCAIAALALAFGIGSALAAGSTPSSGMLVKNEDGVVSHSPDSGQTWKEGAPSNYYVESGKDGSSLSWVGDEKPVPGGDSFAVKIEDGVPYYSTDGGETWSDTLPEGHERVENPDGSVGFIKGRIGDFAQGSVLIQNEDGQMRYSLDGGETWIEGSPGDFHVEQREDGSTLSWIGSEKPTLDKDTFVVKNENGVLSYSTDGGETWSDTLPEGYERFVEEDGAVGIKKSHSI